MKLGLLRQGSDPVEAEKALREALALQDNMVKRAPQDRDYRVERLACCAELAHQLQGRGKAGLAEAGQLYARAESDFRTLAKEVPGEPTYRLSLGSCLADQIELHRQQRKPKEAEQDGREAEQLLAELAAHEPNQPVYRKEQARALHNLGVLYNTLDRLTESEATHRKALALRKELVKQFAGEPAYRHDLATSHGELGIAQARETVPTWPSRASLMASSCSKRCTSNSRHRPGLSTI